MPKAVLSKSGLQRERDNLRLYRKVLPSLDLKRRQLLGEQKRAERALGDLRRDLDSLPARVAKQLPMLGSDAVEIAGLVRLRGTEVGVENVVGVNVPTLEDIDFEDRPYSLLGKPHWVDLAVQRLKEFIELKTRSDIAAERVTLLRQAARKITQRVNLFEKRLIPTANANIKRIQIYLADAERAAVVQSKIAKAKGRSRALAAAETETTTARAADGGAP